MNITLAAIADFADDIDGMTERTAPGGTQLLEWATPAGHKVRVIEDDETARVLLMTANGVILAESTAAHGSIAAVAFMAASQVRAMLSIDEIEAQEMAS